MLRTRVYAGPISNLTDGRYFASFGVEWLGFQLEPEAQDYLEPAKAAEIKGWLHGVQCVAEFAGHADGQSMAERAQFLQADAVLLPLEALAHAEALSAWPLIVAAQADAPDFAWSALPERTEAVVLDLRGMALETHEAAMAACREAFADQAPDAALMVELDLSAEALPAWLEAHPGVGIRLRGGKEEQVGLKLFDALDPYMAVLEVED